ncbi:MAG: hypothetical protein F4X94_09745 [Dehalococcoidia bacterium]|nr:hypothetical protein [Dehalococcoidia bacterium]
MGRSLGRGRWNWLLWHGWLNRLVGRSLRWGRRRGLLWRLRCLRRFTGTTCRQNRQRDGHQSDE